MNVGFVACGFLCIIFLFFALLFTIMKDRAAILISGFNSMPKEQRKCYDKETMSRDQRNAFLIWASILGVGAVLACWTTQHIAIIAFAVWLIVFFKDVHFDVEKAFGKYKLK